MNINKKKIVFLVSGNGGNFHFIYEAIKRKYLKDHEIINVVADRHCGAIDIARKKNIAYKIIDFRDQDQINLHKHLIKLEPDLIITSIHKIINTKIIKTFEKKLINLHYSLLPSFGGLIGMTPVQHALKEGCSKLGVTTHYAEKEVDMGEHIAQISFSSSRYTFFSDELANLIFRCGCLCLLAAINKQQCFNNDFKPLSIDVLSEKCLLSGAHLPCKLSKITEDFWEIIQNKAA
mgnify:CR=1 FL=1